MHDSGKEPGWLWGIDENVSENVLENRSVAVTRQGHGQPPVPGQGAVHYLPRQETQNQQTHNSKGARKSPRNLTFGLNEAGEPLHWAATKRDDAHRSFLTTVTGQAPPFPVPHSCSYWFYLFPEADGKTGIFLGYD